jgi:hypothetical protein
VLVPRFLPLGLARLPLGLALLSGLALLLAACDSAAQPSAAVPVPTAASSGVVRAEAVEGPYRLVFELEDDTFAVDEPIDGRAWLETDGEPVQLWASGSGLVLFDLREIGGTRGMGGATDDCHAYDVDGRTEPMPIEKSVGYSMDDPDAAWYISFANDPLLRLPEGRWELAASATFPVGECGGDWIELRAPINITVGP